MDPEEEFEIYPLEIGAYYKVASRLFHDDRVCFTRTMLAGPTGGMISPATVLLCARRVRVLDRIDYPRFTLDQPRRVYRKWVQLDYFHIEASGERTLHQLDLPIRGSCPQPWGYDLVKMTSPLEILALCSEGLVP